MNVLKEYDEIKEAIKNVNLKKKFAGTNNIKLIFIVINAPSLQK